MNEENRCRECGAPLPAHSPQGLCPGCLLKRGVETAPPAAETGQASGDFTPPTPEQLAAQFPDLEIIEFIGRGGMGMVYKARQKRLDRLVALKILLPSIARDPAFAERFTREARAMAMLGHAHIVTVHDFGQTSSLLEPSGGETKVEGGLYYFVMEFVDGLTLRQLLDAGKLAPQEALAIVPQICEALQYAHDKGVVHRDIKPENILMDRSGCVKIADFGLAKLVGQQTKDYTITGTGQVMGTPHYMAPEQLEHPQEVDHRADIYSLGVVFYQMLTGELPIGRFAPPSQRVQVDVRLDQVVLRALEKEPGRRYQQVSEVKTQVESIAATPGAVSPATGPTTSRDAEHQVRGPAIGLLITGILDWLVLPVIAMTVVSMKPAPNSLDYFDATPLVMALLAILFLSSFMIFAALKMKQLETYGLAIAASILAILISPGNLIGLPIGIWSLVVLTRADVQAAFARRKQEKGARRPATPTERRLGVVALVCSMAAYPLALLFLREPIVVVSLILLLLIALICGIAGRGSTAGKLGICLFATFLALGLVVVMLVSADGQWHGFRDVPSVVHYDAHSVTSRPPDRSAANTAAEQESSDDDQLSNLDSTRYGTALPPVDADPDTLNTVEVLDVGPHRFTSLRLKRTDYGLPVDASPEQVAAKAEKGDLYVTLSAKAGTVAGPAQLVPLRGATLFPLESLSDSQRTHGVDIERAKRMSRSQIAALGDAFLDAHRSDESRATNVAEGQTYALVRPDGETFVIGICELSQNADHRNQRLELSMLRLGTIPWGTKFCTVDTRGEPVAGASATFSIRERLEKVDGVATYQTLSPSIYHGDAQGCIRLPPLPRGTTFHGEVAASGFLAREDIDGSRDKDGRYLPPGVDGKVQLKRPCVIEGRVVGPDDKPLVHAPLSVDTLVEYPNGTVGTANHLRAISDEHGRFRIEGVPPGKHRIYYPWSGPTRGEVDSGRWRAFEIKKEGGVVVPLPLTGYGLVKPITVDEGTTVRDVVLDFSQSKSTIEGEVLGAAGKPVTGASVRVLWHQGDGQGGKGWQDGKRLLPDIVTDAAGHYRVEHLPPGPFQLYAIPPGMKVVPEKSPAAAHVELAPHQVLRQDLQLATGETRERLDCKWEMVEAEVCSFVQ
ncbi:MAG: protein kinase domain-containing protein [Thermoguttaceae bacterium]